MSGGHFDYIQYRIDDAAEEIASTIARMGTYDEDYDCNWPEYSPETVQKMRECEATLRKAAAMLHRVDWLLSGDDSEETFHERWKHDLQPHT